MITRRGCNSMGNLGVVGGRNGIDRILRMYLRSMHCPRNHPKNLGGIRLNMMQHLLSSISHTPYPSPSAAKGEQPALMLTNNIVSTSAEQPGAGVIISKASRWHRPRRTSATVLTSARTLPHEFATTVGLPVTTISAPSTDRRIYVPRDALLHN